MRNTIISQAVYNLHIGRSDWDRELKKRITDENVLNYIKQAQVMKAKSVENYLLKYIEENER